MSSGSSISIPELPTRPKQSGTEPVEMTTAFPSFKRVKPCGLFSVKVSLGFRIELALPLFVLAGYARAFPKGSSTD